MTLAKITNEAIDVIGRALYSTDKPVEETLIAFNGFYSFLATNPPIQPVFFSAIRANAKPHLPLIYKQLLNSFFTSYDKAFFKASDPGNLVVIRLGTDNDSNIFVCVEDVNGSDYKTTIMVLQPILLSYFIHYIIERLYHEIYEASDHPDVIPQKVFSMRNAYNPKLEEVTKALQAILDEKSKSITKV